MARMLLRVNSAMTWRRRLVVFAIVAATLAGARGRLRRRRPGRKRSPPSRPRKLQDAEAVQSRQMGARRRQGRERGMARPSEDPWLLPHLRVRLSGRRVDTGGRVAGTSPATRRLSTSSGLYRFKHPSSARAVGARENFGGRFDTGLRVGWRDATQIGFYGLGNEPPRTIAPTSGSAGVTSRPARSCGRCPGCSWRPRPAMTTSRRRAGRQRPGNRGGVRLHHRARALQRPHLRAGPGRRRLQLGRELPATAARAASSG